MYFFRIIFNVFIYSGDLEHKRTVAEEKQILFSNEFRISISQSVSARTGENVRNIYINNML